MQATVIMKKNRDYVQKPPFRFPERPKWQADPQIPLHSVTSPTQDPDNLVNTEEDFLSSTTPFGNPEPLNPDWTEKPILTFLKIPKNAGNLIHVRVLKTKIQAKISMDSLER